MGGVTLTGLTFKNCQTAVTFTNYGTGHIVNSCSFFNNVYGISFSSSSATIRSSTFFNSPLSSTGDASIVALEQSSFSNSPVTVGINTVFRDNGSSFNNCMASSMVVNPGAHLTLINSTFFNNVATRGGALFFSTTASSSSIMATIADSIFDKNTANGHGGAIFSNNSVSLTITRTTFKNNHISSNVARGGGLYVERSSLLIIRESTFISNTAQGDAAGAFFGNCPSVEVTSSSFISNSATSGGGIYSVYSQGTVNNVTIESNSARMQGGGTYTLYSVFNFQASRYYFECGNLDKSLIFFLFRWLYNSAVSSGGVYAYDSTLSFSHSTLHNNTAQDYGGGINSVGISASLYITHSNFTSNYCFKPSGAQAYGGAILNNNGILVVNSSLFSNNYAASGGAIRSGGIFTLGQSSFISNTATSFGGAIYQENTKIIVEDSFIIGNWANSGGGIASTATGINCFLFVIVFVIMNICSHDLQH